MLLLKKVILRKVKKLFKNVGIVLELDKENKIDVFTGMIGSGPAYFFIRKSYEKKLMYLCLVIKKWSMILW